MATIVYTETDHKSIDVIEPLWARLNEHHRVLSPNFSSHYEKFTFEQRRKELLEKAARGLMHISLAKDIDEGRYVGYCVSSVLMDGDSPTGEVDSIFVENAYRSCGIGDSLMKRSIEWMDSKGADKKIVE